MTDDEGAGGLIRRVKEHRSKISVVGLEPADNGIATSDLGKTPAIDVERDGRHGLLPSTLNIGRTGHVNAAGDRLAALAHQHRGRALPAFHWKGHHDGVAEAGPAAETGRFDVEVERSLRDDVETRDGLDRLLLGGSA